MKYLRNLLVALPVLLAATLSSVAQTDADLAAFWDFESGRTGTDVWAVAQSGTAASDNSYDIMGNTNNINTKNIYFEREKGEASLAIVNPVIEGIPSYGGNNVLKSTVFHDQAGYLEWCNEFGVAGVCGLYKANVRGRIDPTVPSGNFTIKNGETAWLGFSIYIPNDYVYETYGWGTVGLMEFQYRRNLPPETSSKGGAFGISLGNGKLHIETKYSPTSLPAQGTKTAHTTVNVQKGVWYSIVANVKFSLNDTGFVKVWVNGGAPVLNKSNISIGYQGMNVGSNIGEMGVDVMTNYHHTWWGDPSSDNYHPTTIPSSVDSLSLYWDSLRLAEVNEGSYALVDPTQDLAPVTGAPAAPGGLTAIADDASIGLSWNASIGATSYSVKRSLLEGGSYTTIATSVSGTSYNDTGLTNGTTYYYVVSATNSYGDSANSAEAHATPMELTTLPLSAATASDSDSNLPGYAIDDNLATRWSELSDSPTASEWLRVQLDDTYVITAIDVAWYKGDERSYEFRVEVSGDGSNWTEVRGQTFSAGVTDQFESFDVTDTEASWVRLVCYGNDVNDYNSISEVLVHGHDATPPDIPTGLTATPDDGEVALSWSAATGATSYNVKRATVSGGVYTTLATGLTSPSYTDTTVTNSVTYYYVVSSTNSAGESASSSEVSATPIDVNELTVSAVTASESDSNVPANTTDGNLGTRWSSQGDGEWIRYQLDDTYTVTSIDIAWYQGNTRAADVRVEISQDNSNWTEVLGLTTSSGSTTQLESHSLTPTNASWLRIVGYGNSINDYNSITEVDIFGYDVVAPLAPAGLAATGSDGEVALSWTASVDATSYQVYRATTTGGSYTAVGSPVSTTSYDDTSVTNGTTYFYVVRASNGGGQSIDSAEVSATPQVAPPSAPTGLTATAGDASAALTWSSVFGASSYNVYRSSDASVGYELQESGVTSTSYNDTGLTNGTTYSYQVTAVNPGGESAASASVDATPQLILVLSVVAATASDSDSNGPANASDNSLSTRWSALSDSPTASEWIKFKLDATYVVTSIDIAWYKGDERSYEFRIEISSDDSNWTEIRGQTFSAGVTDQFENFDVTDATGLWVRLVCYGNEDNDYNSISEVDINGYVLEGLVEPAITAVSSSSEHGTTVDDNAIDGSLGTAWSADGLDEWIHFELVDDLIVSAIEIAWLHGDTREAYFTVEGSMDGSSWFELKPLTASSGTTLDPELYDLNDARCAWVRITGQGNETNDFISLTEVVVLGYEAVDPIVDTADASGFQTGHPAADAVDGNLGTRWSQSGIGEWIRFEFTDTFTVASIGIAWLNGDARQADFEVEASANGTSWTPVSGIRASSGTTTALERYDLIDTETSWIRIIGYGNTDSDWNSINEVEFFGY